MRVLQVHTRYRQPGGEDTVVETERRMLTEAGHEVRLHELRNPTSAGETVRALTRAPWNRRAAEAVVASAKELGAEVVHVHNTWFALSPAVFRSLSEAGFPVVATVHNYRNACVNALFYRDGGPCEDCLGKVPWRGVARACYRDSRLQSAAVALTIQSSRARHVWSRDVDVVVALTDFAALKLAESGVPRDRIAVKPNVADDPGARPDSPSGSRTVLFVGRMVDEKGIFDLLEAWGEPSDPELELMVLGDGPLYDQAVAKAGAGVEFSGAVDAAEVRARMRSGRALVLPSRWYEGLPMVVVEGMASGLPVVVPDHGGLAGVVGAGGIVFESGNVDSLRQALDRLSSNPLVDELGAHARREYEQGGYHPRAGARALEAVYRRAIHRRSTGRETYL